MKNDLFPYPVETLKNWYVTIIGGQSGDLKPNQIGVNREALAENTDIMPYENVLISKLEGRGEPLMTKKYFAVVPLDDASPDATSKSPLGELVLPVQDIEHGRLFPEPFEIGEMIVINNVLGQRYFRGLPGALDRLIKKRSGLHFIEYIDN